MIVTQGKRRKYLPLQPKFPYQAEQKSQLKHTGFEQGSGKNQSFVLWFSAPSPTCNTALHSDPTGVTVDPLL